MFRSAKSLRSQKAVEGVFCEGGRRDLPRRRRRQGAFPRSETGVERSVLSARVMDRSCFRTRNSNVPFAVLGNKIDLPGAASEQELRINLNLVDTFGKDVGGARWR